MLNVIKPMVDEIDRFLLSQLGKNSRTSSYEIAAHQERSELQRAVAARSGSLLAHVRRRRQDQSEGDDQDRRGDEEVGSPPTRRGRRPVEGRNQVTPAVRRHALHEFVERCFRRGRGCLALLAGELGHTRQRASVQQTRFIDSYDMTANLRLKF